METFNPNAPISRRNLLLSAGATSLALASGSRRAFAAGAENTLRVGFISPRTGPLGGFGQTDGYVLDVARAALKNGLKVGDKTYDVTILDQDTQSDPSRAGQLAKSLINGDGVDFLCQAEETLLDVLRDRLGLTGAKEGCGTGDCGACSVTLDGLLVKSCMMLAIQADGARIRTVEGLAPDDELTPLQQAFNEHHALQCGYCTPGMIMAAASLLAETDGVPTEEEVRHGLEGNLCRCTGYQNIVDAGRAAAGA